jgi:hypothetical protein
MRQIAAAFAAVGGNKLPACISVKDSLRKETAMSTIANLTNTQSLLQQLDTHSLGHKKAGHVKSPDDSSNDTAAQVPASTAKSSFGSLLESLEKVVGVMV